MCRKDAEGAIVAGQFCKECAARFQPRKLKAMHVSDAEIAADEDRLAVPAEAVLVQRIGQRDKAGRAFRQFAAEGGGARAETEIDFLQGEDVGMEARHDGQHPSLMAMILR